MGMRRFISWRTWCTSWIFVALWMWRMPSSSMMMVGMGNPFYRRSSWVWIRWMTVIWISSRARISSWPRALANFIMNNVSSSEAKLWSTCAAGQVSRDLYFSPFSSSCFLDSLLRSVGKVRVEHVNGALYEISKRIPDAFFIFCVKSQIRWTIKEACHSFAAAKFSPTFVCLQ